MLIFLLLYYIKAVNVISIDLMTQSKCIGLVIGLQKKKTLYNIDIQGLKFNLVGVRRLELPAPTSRT
jgi:presenilin-like A22 family membrane protease